MDWEERENQSKMKTRGPKGRVLDRNDLREQLYGGDDGPNGAEKEVIMGPRTARKDCGAKCTMLGAARWVEA